ITRATLWVNVLWALALVPALLAGARLGGIQGAAMAHASVAVGLALPMLAFALHRARVPVRLFAAGLARPVLGAVAAGAVMAALATVVEGAFVQLCAAGGAGVLLFVLVAVPRAAILQLVRGGRAH